MVTILAIQGFSAIRVYIFFFFLMGKGGLHTLSNGTKYINYCSLEKTKEPDRCGLQ